MINDEENKEISSATKEQFDETLKQAFVHFIQDLKSVKKVLDVRNEKRKEKQYSETVMKVKMRNTEPEVRIIKDVFEDRMEDDINLLTRRKEEHTEAQR